VQVGRILEAAPTLRALARGARTEEAQPLVQRIARRMAVDADDPRPRVIVAAMTAVAAAEWQAWVDDGGVGDPAERIGAALSLIERGLEALDRKRPSRGARTA
jgi:hypothetical protein